MMKKRFKAKIILLLMVLNCEATLADSGFLYQLIQENKELSKEIDSMAAGLDEILSRRNSSRNNPSQIRLSSNTQWTEGGEVSTLPQLGVNLRLPALEKKWRLRFSTYDELDQYEGLRRNRDGALPSNRKAGASVEWLQKVGNLNFLVRPRFEFRDPIVTGFLFRLDQSVYFTKKMSFNWRKKFFLHSIDGVGQSLETDFVIRLGDETLLSLFNEFQYLDQDNFFEVSQGPSLGWNISDRMAWSQTFSVVSLNRFPQKGEDGHQYESYHLSRYRFVSSFGHKILKNVFHYQISPSLDFAKIYNFKGKVGFNFQMSLIF